MPLRSSQLRRSRHDVVHVLATATAAGIAQARIVASLAAGLDPRRYRVEAWFLDRPGPLTSMLEDAGVHTRALRFAGAGDTRGTLRFARALITTHPSIIHFHVGGRARIWLAAALPTTKVIVHVGAAFQEDGRALNRGTAALRSADAVICTSHSVARLLSPHATVAWPGVELPPDPPTPVEGTAPTIGTAARLEPVKHISALVEAVAELRERHPRLRLEIAGTGSCEPRLRRQVRDRGLEPLVSFLGWQSDIALLHRRWCIFVIPSVSEGFGLSALEAMASGLPVVASAVGGLNELVEDGVTGFLVPPRDTRELADRIDRLLRSSELRMRMGAAARARASAMFSREQMVETIEGVYRQLLDG